jgi:predicted nucleotide-binding protein
VPYYHVRITVLGERRDEVKVDVDEETLERQFLEPYREGRSIMINGRVVPPTHLQRIRISVSDWATDQVIPMLKAEDARSSVAMLGGPSYQARAAARADDVTDQFITGPPGEGAPPASLPPVDAPDMDASGSDGRIAVRGPGDRASVFVVAGRDAVAYSSLIALLRALGLRVVEWEHAVAKTGLPNPYVGDVIVTGLQMADAVVVLFSPDDVVELRADLVRDDDEPHESQRSGQARPNVYYEAGIADALGRHRTVLVEIGRVKSFSDAAGRHVVRYDGSPAKRNALAERLRVAGVMADTSGSEWLTVGDVAPAIEAANDALTPHATTE